MGEVKAQDTCGFCEGTGAVDSGGVTPWMEAIFVKCGACNGTGKVLSTGAK